MDIIKKIIRYIIGFMFLFWCLAAYLGGGGFIFSIIFLYLGLITLPPTGNTWILLIKSPKKFFIKLFSFFKEYFEVDAIKEKWAKIDAEAKAAKEEAEEDAEVEAEIETEEEAEIETEDILESRPEESISSIIGNEYPDLPNQLSEIEITDLNTLNAKFYKDEYFLVSLFKYQAVDNEKIKILVRKRLEEIEEWDKQEPERIRAAHPRPILKKFIIGSLWLGIIGLIWSFFSENNNIFHYSVYSFFLLINLGIYDSTFGYTKGWGRFRKLLFDYSIIIVLIIGVYTGNFGDFAREFLLIILEDGFNLDIQYDYYYWDGL